MTGTRTLTRRLYAALFTVSLAAAHATPAAAADARVFWKQGTEAAAAKQPAEAIESFTMAIRTNKGEIGIEQVAEIFNARGLVYEDLRKYDSALDDFGNAIRLDDRYAAAYNNRGLVYAAQGRSDEALEDFNRAITVRPAVAAQYVSRGTVYLKRQDYDRAIGDFGRALEIDPRNVAAYDNRGIAYKNKLQYDRALGDLGKALEIAPKDPSAGYQKAAIYSLTGKVDVACTWLEIAAENGFRDWAAVKASPDFDGIRKTDCYRKLMAGR